MLIDSLNLGRPLDGEVVLVTGAGGGIGKEAALVLAALGASIAIAEIDDSGRATERAIWDRGGQARFFQVDVSDPTAMESLKQQAIARFNRVDIVVNNAVVFYAKPLIDYSTEEWDRVMAVNLRGAFLTAKMFLPSMVAQGHGIFITMESGDGMPFMAPYFASKVALRSLASSISQELGPDSGVSVFCFGAGMVDTPGLRAALPRLAPLYRMTEQEFIGQSAPGGVLMTAEECGTGLAGCILYAPRFHGQETAAIAGLELLRLRLGETAGPSIDPAPADFSPDRRQVLEAVDELIAGLRREFQSLGMFQRQWYKRTLKQRSGLSLDEWQTLSQKIKSDPAVAPRFASDLKKLAEYFTQLESDARGYIRDPDKLEAAIAALEARRSVADKASAALRT
jgi:NAD(P)-dependent dehydrogenase (short-subunit alcohol dehydrogenase family)